MKKDRNEFMKYIKLFESWKDSYLSEGMDDFIKSQIALLGKPSADIKSIERELNDFVGDSADISIERKSTDYVSIDNKKVEQKVKDSEGVDSVVILKVKPKNQKIDHTFLIPSGIDSDIEKDGADEVVDTYGNVQWDKDAYFYEFDDKPIYSTKDSSFDINIGGIFYMLNDLSSGSEIDIKDALAAKVLYKHTF